MSPLSGATLRLTRRLAASPRRVFEAWTDPAKVAQWLRPGPQFELAIAEVDARAGGEFRLGYRAADSDAVNVVSGQYLTVDPYARLVFTWVWQAPHTDFDQHTVGRETIVTVTLVETNGGTHLTLLHEGLPIGETYAAHMWGWAGALDQLVDSTQTQPTQQGVSTVSSIEFIKQSLQFSTNVFLSLAEDLRDAPMAAPFDGGNHATWCVGHLAYSEGALCSMIFGGENPLARWKELFAAGTTPSDDASVYPAYNELMDQFKSMRQRTLERLDALTDADLAKPPAPSQAPANAPGGAFQTIGSVLSILILHPMHHRGQLADARKALQRAVVIA
jgi:uncharacterized protein YndB with AHSA1/START domain